MKSTNWEREFLFFEWGWDESIGTKVLVGGGWAGIAINGYHFGVRYRSIMGR